MKKNVGELTKYVAEIIASRWMRAIGNMMSGQNVRNTKKKRMKRYKQ